MLIQSRRRIKALLWGLLGLILLTAVAVYSLLRASLPQLDGQVAMDGLSQPVSLQRDGRGMASLTAANRLDLARALGFVHGQERFFQMDLMRRNSAGELSALFGEAALERDREIRLHRFRSRAERRLTDLPEAHHALVKAYSEGVNQGLNALDTKPFEYWLLQASPKPWQATDTLLVLYSMYLDLQYHDGRRERSLTALNEILPPELYAFLQPPGSRWDAPIDGSKRSANPIPQTGWPNLAEAPRQAVNDKSSGDAITGSNNWAVSGALTPYKSGMLADDMHLGLRVPNIWYRAQFNWQQNGQAHQLTGVTLPGTPLMVVGSNGKVAWGFTNSYGDWNDLIRLKLDDSGERYLTQDGYERFSEYDESIAIKGQDSDSLTVRETRWGPVIGEDSEGNLLAYRWVAHDAQGANLNLLNMETATDLYQAMETANRSGIPAQNIMLADSQGNIGWSIAGAMPIRNIEDGQFISDWSQPGSGWQGYRSAESYPRVINPEQQRLWTANARVVGGKAYDKIGDGGYALGARAQQIQQRLFEQDSFTEQDLFAIQMDSEALFLSPWRELLLQQGWLVDYPTAHRAIENWSGYASKNDLGYLLVRQFRIFTRNAVFSQLNSLAEQHDSAFHFRAVRNQMESALWAMVSEQPPHLLPKDYDSWPELLQQSWEQALADLDNQYGNWQTLDWGRFNAVAIKHPLSPFIPGLGWLTDMPDDKLAGDSFMPNVSRDDFGASQRLVVAPGHEDSGILQMPSSQSSHPLSPYFASGHDDWVNGRPTPLLPEASEYHLTLTPAIDKDAAAQ
ncbi:Penicillin amidase [Saliniradius amylolyticus]|uniref:Penicillin amidase n=1 Tax=Saliniradius amylolyticus TaxID=2183582 RepID=A0A2S2E3X6_9ALTE|nr:penicillin acylase family protein [Saliniradius amylolyticus]AWL12345.1 Penicillin amidase [Saliniradius amylolyticus]